MRLTLLAAALVAALVSLASCAATPHSHLPAPSPQEQEYGPPAPAELRTEKDLPTEKEQKKKPRVRALGHVRVDLQGGAFLEDEVDDIFDSTWGLGVSGGVFLSEHFSIGAMLDFNAAYDEEDYHFNNQKVGKVETTLSVFTFSPMAWLHLTSASAVKNDGTPSVAVGAGPSFVAAYVDYDVDTILGDYDDDDDDTGWGYQVEVVGEVPLTRDITLAGGARYAVKKMGDFDDLNVVMGFLGIGIRF